MLRVFAGVALDYDVQGSGPVVVLLHGFSLDRRMWDENIAALAEKFRVVRLDFRGAGATPLGDDEPFSLVDLADDVARLLDGLGVPMAAIIGLSMGGYVALAFAQRHRARLSALVLADTRAADDGETGKLARDVGIAGIQQFGVVAFAENIPARLLGPAASIELQTRVKNLAASQSASGLIAALTAMRARPDRTAELAAIDCPTLLVVGELDAIAPPDEARAMAAQITGAKVHLIPGVGHISNMEAPAAFNHSVVEFLEAELLKT